MSKFWWGAVNPGSSGVVVLLLTVFAAMRFDKCIFGSYKLFAPDSASFKRHIISAGVYLHNIFKQEGIITLTTTHKQMEWVFSLYKNRRSQLRKDTTAPTVSVTPHQCNEHENLLFVFVIFGLFVLFWMRIKEVSPNWWTKHWNGQIHTLRSSR